MVGRVRAPSWARCHRLPVCAQIVRQDRSMEQIVFPVPGICQFLTEETKHRLFTTTEQDEQGSKVSDFFDQSSFLHNEMEWQRKLRSEDPARGGGGAGPAGGCPTPSHPPHNHPHPGLQCLSLKWGLRLCGQWARVG